MVKSSGTPGRAACAAGAAHVDSSLMSALVGTPSDASPAVVATGRTDVTTIFTSFSERHPEGLDADYLEWHSLDHRPEQQRLTMLRTSFRLVSTPACRAARAVSEERFDATDHLMTYLFTGLEAMDDFNALSVALREAGRAPYLLPMVERAAYRLDGMAAAPRIKIGADVLPWWPARGVYILVERGEQPARRVWSTFPEWAAPGGAGQSPWSPRSAPGTTAACRSATSSSMTNHPTSPGGWSRLSGSAGRRRQSSRCWLRRSTALVAYDWGRYCP